ncbi:MAG TPA: PAS domain-containing protein, partial [Candidatus Acidoferrum sp.]|nr:PAS domain-containing protein [Candidatus Acidoferrum sp.]
MGYEKAFWEKVVESADSLIVVLDTRGKIRLFNRKARKVTGYLAREVLGKSWVKTFVPPKYQPTVQGIFDSLPGGKSVPQYAEYPILSKQGREIPVAWDRTFIKDQNARTEALLSVGHDLSLTKTMEEERRRNQTILDSIADGVFTVAPDMRITSFNRAATKITGFDPQEAIGQRCSDILR